MLKNFARINTRFNDYFLHSCNAGPGDPYLKFFKTRPDRAAIWQTLPPLKLEEMNLTQKATAITEMVILHIIAV